MSFSASPAPDRKSGKVLACIDESRYAESVCDFAAWSAERMEAPLSLLHVIPSPPGGRTDSPQNLSGSIGFRAREGLLEELAALDEARARLAVEQGRLLLEAATERIGASYGEPIETRQRHGELVDAVVALEPETRMLVLGKRGTESESEHGHLGGHLEAVIRAMNHPVLVAQQSFAPPERVMFAWDGSPTARRGVEMVAQSPLFRGIPIHLVAAGDEGERQRRSLDEASAVLSRAGFETVTAVVDGEPETALPVYQATEEVDLLIMGAYGHSRIRRFLVGSTTTAMIQRCRVSLMVLR